MFKLNQLRPLWCWAAGLAMGLLVGAGMMIGTLVSTQWTRESSPQLPPTLLHAVATHGSDEFAMATGPVSDDSEGVFFLDFLTGELQCWVLYPRTGVFGGKFMTNVVNDLGVEKGKMPKYVMVTGTTQFLRGAGAARPANCVVYVADANTGNFAAYSLPWSRTLESNNRPQIGALGVVAKGRIRNLDISE